MSAKQDSAGADVANVAAAHAREVEGAVTKLPNETCYQTYR